jgi:phospholipase C
VRLLRRRALVALVVAAVAGVAAAALVGRLALTSAPHIAHIVFILEENRSFDNVFGRFPGADGASAATVDVGGHVATTALVPEPYYAWHDLGHDLGDAEAAIDRGRMDGFSHETYADLFGDKAAYQQLGPQDVPNLYAYARHFTLADHTFAPVPTPTFPVHLHTIAAQDGGVVSNPQNGSNAWGCDAARGTYVLRQTAPGRIVKSYPCYTFATLATSLDKAHLSWRYYAAPPSDLGYIWSTFDAIKPIRDATQWSDDVHDERTFEADARAGRLPAFSWLTPRAADSMHPPAPVCPGENWVVSKINAVMQGPDWDSTMIVLAWDDWGGYYDHVAPPAAPVGSYGLRVPLLVISPYARRGAVAHTLYTFESVLKTAEVLWHLPPLTRTDRTAHSLLDTLNLKQAPARPYILPQRACPRPVTAPLYHALLDQQLQRVLAQQVGLPIARIEALHRQQTLGAIVRRQHRNPATVLAALKTVTAAWDQGKVILQLVAPSQSSKDEYLTLRAIDRWFGDPARTRLFPSPMPP